MLRISETSHYSCETAAVKHAQRVHLIFLKCSPASLELNVSYLINRKDLWLSPAKREWKQRQS